MPEGTMKIGRLERDIAAPSVTVRKADNGGTVLDFSASSETPVERWFGTEILSHKKSAVDLERCRAGAVPLLFNHNWSDPIGMVDSGDVGDGRLQCTAHLFDTPRAREVATMIAGGLRNISIGYDIDTIEEQTKTDTYTATRWALLECSVVTIPADYSIGVDRAAEGKVRTVRVVRADGGATDPDAADEPAADKCPECGADCTNDVMCPECGADCAETKACKKSAEPAPAVGAKSVPAAGVQTRAVPPAQPATFSGAPKMPEATIIAPAGDNAEAKKSAFQIEENRKRSIVNICKANKLDGQFERHWIESGSSLDTVAEEMLAVMVERGATKPTSAADIGLTDREVSNYSWFRALRVLAAGQGEVENARKQAGFEIEASRAVAQKLGRDPAGLFVPFDVQRGTREQRNYAQRDMVSGLGAKGGYMVETENLGFIEILRNRSVLMRMGATNLSGLEGNVTFPRQVATATLSWQNTESTAVTSTDQSLGQLSMTAKNAIAVTNISRQLMMQSSPSAEQMVRADLAAVVGLGVDFAGIQGAGGASPIGIINTAGITTGITGTTLAYSGAVTFQTSVASANALRAESGGYVTTPTIAGALMGRSRFANTDTPLWNGNVLNGIMAGFGAMSSLQMPTSNMLFGDWSQVVVGEWGVLELALNPYQNFNAALFALRAIYSVDILVRYPQAFALSTNMS